MVSFLLRFGMSGLLVLPPKVSYLAVPKRKSQRSSSVASQGSDFSALGDEEFEKWFVEFLGGHTSWNLRNNKITVLIVHHTLTDWQHFIENNLKAHCEFALGFTSSASSKRHSMNHKKVYCREVGNFQISRAPLLSVWNDMRAYLYHSATRKRFEINPSARMGDEFERILSKSSPSRKADNLEVLSQSFLICQKMTSRNLLHHFRVHFLRNKQVQGVVCLGSNKKTSMKLQASDVFIGWASCLKAWKTCIENDFSFRNFEAFSVSSKMAAWAFAKPRLAPVTKSFGKHFRMKNLCWLHFTCIGKIGNALISPWQSWYGLLNNQSIHPSSIAFNCVSCCTSVILGETRSFVDLEHEDRSADESSTSRRGFKDFKFIAAISQISLDFCFSEQIIPARIKKKKLFDSGRQQLDQGHFGHFSLGDPLSTLPLRRPGKSFFFWVLSYFLKSQAVSGLPAMAWNSMKFPWNSMKFPWNSFLCVLSSERMSNRWI